MQSTNLNISQPTNQDCCSRLGDDENRCGISKNGLTFSYKRRPASNPKSSDIVAQTAKDLNELSSEAREKLFEEVNGISSTEDEDPELVEQCLEGFEEEIEQVQLDKSAYNLAMAMRPQLRKDREFRLMFLRAECFDLRRAARRIVQHFECKRTLFGDEKLAKRITYEDLDDDDKAYLSGGSFQILQSKDQTGRTVIFVYGDRNTHKTWKNQVRVIRLYCRSPFDEYMLNLILSKLWFFVGDVSTVPC